MKQRVSKLVLVVALAVLGLSGCSAGQTTGVEHIADYSIDYTLRQSGTVHAVETITYDFGGQSGKHGIDRFLAMRFTAADGQDRVYRYRNIAVTSPSGASALFSTSQQNSLRIRVGNANATVRGTQVYRIAYDIVGALNRAPQDDGSALDEFYWNATGTYWDVPISRATVKVSGPAGVTRVACFAGPTGSTAPCSDATATGQTATFSARDLPVQGGLTIDAGYPDGTFASTDPILEPALPSGAPTITTGSNEGPDPFWSPGNWGVGLGLAAGIPALFGLLVVARRRDREFVGVTPGTIPDDPANAATGPAPRAETVIVYYAPPVGFPVGAANTVLVKKRKTIDITATLIDLAVRGYVRIEEVDGGNRHRAKDYRIVSTPERAAAQKAGPRPSPDLLPHEQLLLAKLFKGHGSSVALSTLRNTFAAEMRTITAALDAWIESRKFFVDRLSRVHPALGAVFAGSIVLFVVMTFVPNAWYLIPVGAFVGAGLATRSSARAARRSATGHALYLQIEGFRQYIATAEADRIRFDETEDVFSRYMPWAIVFGEAERWARVFSELAAEGKFTAQPDWYVGNPNAFAAGYLAGSIASIASIGSAVSSFSEVAGSSMTSTPSSSGGSGFSSGGGFSGGGGGGGGGGSW
jgi:uncharacterized membrane protein YgcG